MSRAIDNLIGSGMVFPSDMDANKAPAIYRFALSKQPVAAIRKVVGKLIRGEYPSLNAGFLPRPPELAQLVRSETAPLVNDVANLRARREALLLAKDRVNPQPDEDAKARVRALRIKAVADLKTKHVKPEDDIAGKGADYWEKISAVKDAPVITEDHLQFRSKVEAAIAPVSADVALELENETQNDD